MKEAVFNLLTEYVEKYPDVRIYGIFDGVKYPMLWSDLEDGILPYDMLFREEALRNEMQEVAPFLVGLDFTDTYSTEESKKLMQCYGQNGCIFLATVLPLEKTLERMRELFYVYNAKHELGYLRFYSPSIFTELVKQEHDTTKFNLFYEIEGYWCENEIAKESILHYKLKNDKMMVETIRLKNEK